MDKVTACFGVARAQSNIVISAKNSTFVSKTIIFGCYRDSYFVQEITTSSNGPLRNTSPVSSKPDSDGPPAPKRLAFDPEDIPREIREARERFERFMPPHFAMPSAHLKITSRSEFTVMGCSATSRKTYTLPTHSTESTPVV